MNLLLLLYPQKKLLQMEYLSTLEILCMFLFFISAFGISTIFSSFGILFGAIIGILLIHKYVVLEEEKKTKKTRRF